MHREFQDFLLNVGFTIHRQYTMIYEEFEHPATGQIYGLTFVNDGHIKGWNLTVVKSANEEHAAS